VMPFLASSSDLCKKFETITKIHNKLVQP